MKVGVSHWEHLRTVASAGCLIFFTQEAVLDCSCSFLSWTRTRKGNSAKDICKPGDATSHKNTETDEEGKDTFAHVCFWQEG